MIAIIISLIGLILSVGLFWGIRSYFMFKNKISRQQTLLQCYDKRLVSWETIMEQFGLNYQTERQRMAEEGEHTTGIGYNITINTQQTEEPVNESQDAADPQPSEDDNNGNRFEIMETN